MAERKKAGEKAFGKVAPGFAAYTDEVLNGDLWQRPGLSARDRSLVTVAALTALYRPEQIETHLRIALGNGLTREELAEAITHLAFYSGWPAAWSAMTVLKRLAEGEA